MVVGRNREMDKLNTLHKNNKFECIIMYGRRRVGKTSIIQEFIKNKRAIYFLALEASERVNLNNFSKAVWTTYHDVLITPPRFNNFSDALDAIADLARNERVVLAIDEYPYLASSVAGCGSIFQAAIDTKLKDTQLFFILCGSSMSFMENQVLGYESPLYGRRTAQFKIEPFDFFESMHFHPLYDVRDSAVAYGVTGGIPHYLGQFDDNQSIEENIIHSFFDSNSYLYEEPANLLKQELREPQVYNDIITAIATGSSRQNEISTKAQLNTSVASKYLKTLISLGIVQKECPILGGNKKQTLYKIADGMFRFWYRFVPNNASQIAAGAGKRVYAAIKPQISAFMGQTFEDICKQYLWRENLADRLPFYFHECGRWWGSDPKTKTEQEIDLIAYEGANALFCECKWSDTPVGVGVLHGLIKKSEIFSFANKYFALFSKTGFTDECKKAASKNMRLISIDKMV